MATIIVVVIAIILISLSEYFSSRDWESETSQKKNNVIFKFKNKKYGAFKIRNDYNDTLMFIIFSIAFVVLVLSIFSLNYRLIPPPVATNIIIDTTTFELPPPPIEEVKTIKLPYKIKGGGSSGGEGTPSNAKVDPNPKPQVKNQSTIEQSNTSVNSGKSDKTNGDNKDNEATSMKKSPNPFGSGGGGTRGDGQGIFGNDDGPYHGGGIGKGNAGTGSGYGDGPGSGSGRKMVANIKADDLQFNQSCRIVLYLTINAEGNVVNTEVIMSETTTTNQTIINKVRELAKQQIKFNKKQNADLEKIKHKINITPI